MKVKKEINNKLGFTLLELLVVVLIIGILAAIALPQYQRVVAKSKAAQMYEAVSTMTRVAQSFYMINGSWPSTFDQLDIDYDLTGAKSSVCGSSSVNGGIKRNGEFEFLIASSSNFSQMSVRLASGPYKCTGFSIFFRYPPYSDLENKLLCYEKSDDSVRGSKNQQGDFCEKVMGYKFYKGGAGNSDFFIQ